MFKSFPIFHRGLECQLFMLMAFIGSRKHLSCMLGFFSEQTGHVGCRRRPWCQAFFFLLNFSFKCLVEILPEISKHFQLLIKWGLWSGKRRECQQMLLQTALAATARSSIKCLLTEARTSPRRPSLREINGMLTIKKTCFEGSEFCKVCIQCWQWFQVRSRNSLVLLYFRKLLFYHRNIP